MKNVIKILKSKKMYADVFDIVKLCKKDSIYSVEYKYASMDKYKIYKTNDLKLASYEFLRITLFILS